MKTTTCRFLFAFTVLVSMGSLSSCSYIFAKPTGRPMEYIRGELQTKFDRPLKDTWEATQAAIEGSGLQVKSKRADSLSAVLKAEDAQTRSIEITNERVEDNLTVVRVHVGLLGDAEFSKQLMDLMRKK